VSSVSSEALSEGLCETLTKASLCETLTKASLCGHSPCSMPLSPTYILVCDIYSYARPCMRRHDTCYEDTCNLYRSISHPVSGHIYTSMRTDIYEYEDRSVPVCRQLEALTDIYDYPDTYLVPANFKRRNVKKRKTWPRISSSIRTHI
jgi:hypothetical protein